MAQVFKTKQKKKTKQIQTEVYGEDKDVTFYRRSSIKVYINLYFCKSRVCVTWRQLQVRLILGNTALW